MAAFVAPFVIADALSADGDFARTARSIMASEFLYRLAIAMTLLGVIGIVLLSGALYALLRHVDPNLAAIALSLRVVEAVFMGLGAMLRFPALDNYAAAVRGETGRAALHQLVFSAVNAGSVIAFACLSVGSALYFFLLFRARFIPRLLAGFGMLASMLLGALAFALILIPKQLEGLEMIGMLPLGIVEVTTGFWLLIAGANLNAHRTEKQA
jgi:hypothetical protein